MSKPRILIVEDEFIVARDIRQQLAELGYETAAHTSWGEEAILLAHTLKSNLVLMDIHLAGKMDGIEAAQIIHDRDRLPIVYLTAYSTEKYLDRVMQTEPYGYIIKPFEQPELYRTIEMALHKHQLTQKMRDSEQRLNEAQRIAGVGSWRWDRSRLIHWSDQMYELHHHSREIKPTRESFFASVLEDDRKRLCNQFLSALQTKASTFEIEYRTVGSDGEIHYRLARTTFEHDPAGSILSSTGTVQDISAHKDSERKVVAAHRETVEALRLVE